MPIKKHFDRQKILELREQGRTYQSIAEEVGCSKQNIAQICGKRNPHQFRYITDGECIYPNLKNWMNKNKISRKELIRISKCYESVGSSGHLSNIMRGAVEPTKFIIDKLIEGTGLPYEVLFSKVEYSAVKAVPATQYNELLCKYNELLDAADAFCDTYLRHRRDFSYEYETEETEYT